VARGVRRFALAGLVALLAMTGTAQAASVTNGGFETGDVTGWTVRDQTSGSGSWFVYSGTTSPLSFLPIPAPPEGTFAATTDQTGPGSHLLYQAVTLEAGLSHELRFVLYYDNAAFSFATPNTLDFNVSPNQQYRVDILDPNAPVTSVAAGDVLATVFRTEVGDPSVLGPTTISFDLTPYAGRTVRLRFAEVDNQGFLTAGVDDVRIVSTARTPTSKQACKKGGWRSLANDQGQPFRNQGQCVADVARRSSRTPA
jgi:hypothetical protein